jgi:hypothetical protein
VFEELDGPFMFFRRASTLERPEIPPAATLRIDLPRIEPIFAGLQFADHDGSPRKLNHVRRDIFGSGTFFLRDEA